MRLFRYLTGSGALLAALLCVAVSGDAATSAPAPPAVGATLDTGPGGPDQAFRLFSRAGLTALEAPQPWNELEPFRGRYKLADVASIAQGVASTPAMRVLVIPAAIETTARSVPPDLEHVGWDSPRMIARYRSLIRRLAPKLTRQVDYISIANEADVYFSAHPRELRPFLRFCRAVLAELRRRTPWVKAGVTVTYAGLTSTAPQTARTLSRVGRATILTYYPLGAAYRPLAPDAPLQDIPTMVRLAAGRPLVLQEAGYPSAGRLGSSPTKQAKFVRNVLAASSRYAQRLPFVSFYSLFDPPASACRGAYTHNADAFFCSLGLHTRSGQPKPGWAALSRSSASARSANAGSLRLSRATG